MALLHRIVMHFYVMIEAKPCSDATHRWRQPKMEYDILMHCGTPEKPSLTIGGYRANRNALPVAPAASLR